PLEDRPAKHIHQRDLRNHLRDLREILLRNSANSAGNLSPFPLAYSPNSWYLQNKIPAMKPKPKNLKFSYLYRDEGNYKDFGELVFPNPSGMSPEAASERLRAQLIDGEYFYPKEWGVPLICGE